MSRAVLLLALSIAAAACVQTRTSRVVTSDTLSDELKPAANLPPMFGVDVEPATPGDCPPRLRDEGMGTVLYLRRSLMRAVADSAAAGYRAFGDYAVEPRGRYGEEAGEGLRIDCSRLRALGIARL